MGNAKHKTGYGVLKMDAELSKRSTPAKHFSGKRVSTKVEQTSLLSTNQLNELGHVTEA